MGTHAVKIGENWLRLRIADTPRAQQQGYRGAQQIDPTDGILFQDLPPGASFTMVGVATPLAIAFLDDTGRVLRAQVMQPGEQRVDCPRNTRHAVECHPDHLAQLQQCGHIPLPVRTNRLNVTAILRAVAAAGATAAVGVWIGNVDSYGSVTAERVPVTAAAYTTHRTLGQPNTGPGRFRYREDTFTVYWWSYPPDEMLHAVQNFFAKRDLPVRKSVLMAGDAAAQSASHGADENYLSDWDSEQHP